jgi:hypothetical protein
MGSIRREAGFWTAVGRLRLSDVVSVETISSALLGSGLAWTLWQYEDLGQRVDVATSYVAVSAALVAIVFAGLALVASLLSETYLRLLDSGETGVLGFFRPFMIAVGVQITTVIGALLYSALAELIPATVEPWAFGVLSVLFFASCLEVVVLTRSVLMHAMLRSKFAKTVEATQARQEGR